MGTIVAFICCTMWRKCSPGKLLQFMCKYLQLLRLMYFSFSLPEFKRKSSIEKITPTWFTTEEVSKKRRSIAETIVELSGGRHLPKLKFTKEEASQDEVKILEEPEVAAPKKNELELSIASITDNKSSDKVSERTVISQEETESAVNALLGESAEELTNHNIVDMATAVAMEMEDRRRNEEWEIQGEADALAREAERRELSIDELTALQQLEGKLGISEDPTYQQQVENMHFSYMSDDESLQMWYAGEAKKHRKIAKAKIPRHEMTTFMLCPAFDELVIVKCDKCEKCVKIEAFESHMALRHGGKSEPGDRWKMELPEDEEEQLVELPPLVYIRGIPWQPSPSPPLEPMVTSDPPSSLPQIVTEEADSTSNNVISIPETGDIANIAIISEGLPLLDSMDPKFSSAQTSGPAAASVDLAASSPKPGSSICVTDLPTPTQNLTVSPRRQEIRRQQQRRRQELLEQEQSRIEVDMSLISGNFCWEIPHHPLQYSPPKDPRNSLKTAVERIKLKIIKNYE